MVELTFPNTVLNSAEICPTKDRDFHPKLTHVGPILLVWKEGAKLGVIASRLILFISGRLTLLPISDGQIAIGALIPGSGSYPSI